jgi:hypothetical protein
MNQRHRRHGGRGSTLLYYIGLEGKEDRRTEGRKTEGQRNRKKEKGKEDRRTEEQKKDKREGNLQLPSLFDATNFVTVLYGDFCLLY